MKTITIKAPTDLDCDIQEWPSHYTTEGTMDDDAPDVCAMLVDFITGGIKMVTVGKRLF